MTTSQPPLRRDGVNAYGHKTYFASSPLRNISAAIPEPLHDHIIKECLGGTHGATTLITSMLWDKLFEFVEALNLPHYTTKAQYDTFLRKLASARLAYDPRLTATDAPRVH